MEQRQREIQKQRAEDRNRWNNRSTPARPSFNNNQKRWEQKRDQKNDPRRKRENDRKDD